MGGHMGHDPPLGDWGTTGLPGAPPAYQGHHRPSRGITCLVGAPQVFQGTPHMYLSGPPQACQEYHRPSRTPVTGTTGLPGAPQAC